MLENTFKIGDKVVHKTTDKFNMVIISNGTVSYSERSKELKIGNINPDVFICKYYNPDTTKWEEKRFHFTELKKSES